MPLTVALDHALSGLRATENGLSTVSRNVANAGVPGYVRRAVGDVERGLGGVANTDVQRVLDLTVQRQLRAESSAEGYTTVMAASLGRLDGSFGAPGDAGSLDTLFNNFSSRVQTLGAEPANGTARLEVIGAARALASGLNRLSGDVQALRSDAETALSGAIDEVNALLQTIEGAERQLSVLNGGNARADVLDARDHAVDRLSQLVDIRIAPRGEDGGLSIFTQGGAALFTGTAAQLSFTSHAPLGPFSEHSGDPSLSSVGEIGLADPAGGRMVLSPGMFRSGEIAGLLALRDERLPAVQAGLDAIAGALADAGNEAGVPLFIDAGNGIQPYTGGTQVRGFSARIAVDPALVRDPAPLSPGGSGTRPQALAAALESATRSFAALEGGSETGSIGTAVRGLLERQGALAAEAARVNEGQSVVVNALRERFAEKAGVSVDQEMSNLIALQGAYAANARIVSTVKEMFDALMRI